MFQKVMSKLKDLGVESIEVDHDFLSTDINSDWTRIDEEIQEPVTCSFVGYWASLARVASGESGSGLLILPN